MHDTDPKEKEEVKAAIDALGAVFQRLSIREMFRQNAHSWRMANQTPLLAWMEDIITALADRYEGAEWDDSLARLGNMPEEIVAEIERKTTEMKMGEGGYNPED